METEQEVPDPTLGPGHRRGLDRQRIVAAAIELLDEVGIAELSTRKLAVKLGVRSPTLYWHVRDKAELLDLIADEVCADAFDIDPNAPWREQLEAGLYQFRALILAHRDVATLLRDRPATGPNRLGHVETTLRILLDAGIPVDDAAGISRLLRAHVLTSDQPIAPVGGSADGSNDQMADYPTLRQVVPALARLSDDDLFALGVEIILDGIERRLQT